MKHWWESKTVWFNIAGVLVALPSAMAAAIALLPDEYSILAALICSTLAGVGGLILRFKTDSPIVGAGE